MKTINNILRSFTNEIDLLNTINGGVSPVHTQVEQIENEMQIRLTAPSIQPESFEIVVQGSQLIIHSFLPDSFQQEKPSNHSFTIPLFRWVFKLPSFVDIERIEAVYEEKTLQIHLPFKSEDQHQRRISIQY